MANGVVSLANHQQFSGATKFTRGTQATIPNHSPKVESRLLVLILIQRPGRVLITIQYLLVLQFFDAAGIRRTSVRGSSPGSGGAGVAVGRGCVGILRATRNFFFEHC